MNTLDNIGNLDSKINHARDRYVYQKDLTDHLDGITGDFTELEILKIVLWKLNRYVEVDECLRASINDLKRQYSTDAAKAVLVTLLGCHGIDLPMASAILRFAVPDHLQIIDQRAYRILTGEKLKLTKSIEEKVRLYFEYILLLKEKCHKYDIPFRKADRILYELDKDANADEKLTGY
ncbi:MAG: hypothetical protein ACJ748_15110 [Flavisolibacter sp.]